MYDNNVVLLHLTYYIYFHICYIITTDTIIINSITFSMQFIHFNIIKSIENSIIIIISKFSLLRSPAIGETAISPHPLCMAKRLQNSHILASDG